MKSRRITVSLPPDVVSLLDSLSGTMNVSRSAFLAALLSEALPPMVPLIQVVASAASDDGSRRYRGEFVSELQKMVSSLQEGVEGLQDDLFNDSQK